MEPLRLYINDFMCYSSSYLDLIGINSALIIGRVDNNDLYSNAVGKTTIFKAIEYVLFNHSSEGLDTIVRDETDFCNIVFDFAIDNKTYRVSRTRTKKGTTDLTLYERTAKDLDSVDALHTIQDDIYSPVFDDKYWKDISGRRASDTEKDLEKILKINFKLFRIFVHFVQNDFSGLTTATPEKRKGILKDALNLAVYSKLEKLAKEDANKILKEIEKQNIIIQSLSDQNPNNADYPKMVEFAEKELEASSKLISSYREKILSCNSEITTSREKVKVLEGGLVNLLREQKDNAESIRKLKISSEDFSNKKIAATKAAKQLIADIKESNIKKEELSKLDFTQLPSLSKALEVNTKKMTELSFEIKSALAKIAELNLPLPDENYCKHCRQQLSAEHRKICEEQTNEDIKNNNAIVQANKSKISALEQESKLLKSKIDNLSVSQKQLDSLNTLLTNKTKELEDKKAIHNEYSSLFENSKKEITQKEKFKTLIDEKVESSSSKEVERIKNKISATLSQLDGFNSLYEQSKLHVEKLASDKAIALHNIQKIKENNLKIEEMKVGLGKLELSYAAYPDVIRGFSSVGIPNIIIHGVLDMLQVEANELLKNLKPGLQLTFEVEKLDGDGNEAETLDIVYHDNGRKRNFGQLSGAQQFVVNFSLKLGLSFLLQKMTGVNIKFLLLDEVDQALDKASVDAFSDIVKFFQDDYKIIVITHNDRLKDKFSNAILVNQDLNKISKAQVVSSW